jgi:hypothetical protein
VKKEKRKSSSMLVHACIRIKKKTKMKIWILKERKGKKKEIRYTRGVLITFRDSLQVCGTCFAQALRDKKKQDIFGIQ